MDLISILSFLWFLRYGSCVLGFVVITDDWITALNIPVDVDLADDIIHLLILARKLLVDPEELLVFVHHTDETAAPSRPPPNSQ